MHSPTHGASPRRGWRRLNLSIVLVTLGMVLAALPPAQSQVVDELRESGSEPTVVLVHGAWADASSWNGVIPRLQEAGYKVMALANPLRSLTGDAASVRAALDAIDGPVILVGHSYGGAVISNAATGSPNIEALVYVNAFAPDEGEAATALAGPDSALSADPTTVFNFVPRALPPTAETDLYLKRATVFRSFAPELSRQERAILTATQRPATIGALNEPSGTPAWRTIPSWSLIGTSDPIIPVREQRAMAKRAGSTVTEYDAGHVGLVTHPRAVVRIIRQAANAVGD